MYQRSAITVGLPDEYWFDGFVYLSVRREIHIRISRKIFLRLLLVFIEFSMQGLYRLLNLASPIGIRCCY